MGEILKRKSRKIAHDICFAYDEVLFTIKLR